MLRRRNTLKVCGFDWVVCVLGICGAQLFIMIVIFILILMSSCLNDTYGIPKQINKSSLPNINTNNIHGKKIPDRELLYLNNYYWEDIIGIKNKCDDYYKDRGNSESIFVILASYRDDECKNTILDIFETAKYPNRIRLGVFQQHNITDGDCSDFHKIIDCDSSHIKLLHPLCSRFWQIKIDRIPYETALGPMYGRYRAELFYQGEDFVLQIDAHTRFVPNWDNILIDMFYRVNNEMAVFSTYPKAAKDDTNISKWRPPIPLNYESIVGICQTKMLTTNHMFKHERGRYIRNPKFPSLSPFFAAGFSFARGHRLLNVPYDPYLPYLFDGEEILMSIKLFTFGYDIYTPDRDIVYHIYEEHRKRPLFWKDNWNVEKRKAENIGHNRINYILKLNNKYPIRGRNDLREINKYNIGNKRTIEQYWDWIQFDFNNKQNRLSKDFCNEIEQRTVERIPTIDEL